MSTTNDPILGYLATFDKLRAGKRWSTNTETFRFVALSLGAAGPAVGYDRLESAAETLRRRARWSSPLKSEIRYVVAALILRRGLDVGRVHTRVIETREAFKEHKLSSRGVGPTLAALVLSLHDDGRSVPKRSLERLARIYRTWRSDHPWLTNSNDLPAAALHALRDGSVESLTSDVERAYRSLRAEKFSRGNMLQLVSQLLAVHPQGTDAGVQRFRRITDDLRAAGERVNAQVYDEVAVLALTEESPARIVERVLRYRDRLRESKPRPSKAVALALAAGVALAEETQVAETRGVGDLAALQSIQAILDAQQAVMIATIAAHER